MSDFKLSRERIEDASNVIIQFLRDSGYAGSLEDGTGLADTVVKPNAVLRALMAQLADKACAYQSLKKAQELRDDIGETEYDAAVDCILSNWFVTRNQGKPSRGIIRMWFLQPLDYMRFADGQAVGQINSQSLVANGEQIFTQDSFSLVLNTTENQNEYYVDVAVRTRDFSTIAPTETSNASLSVSYDDIYYLRSTVPSAFVPGILVESSADFIKRTEQAITTRELITARAINTVLLDKFDEIIRLYVARHGSREQLRDIVQFQERAVHVGNKADIYIASSLQRQTLALTADEAGNIDPAQLPQSCSVVAFLGAKDATGQPLELSIAVEESLCASHGYLPREIKVAGSGAVSLDLLTDTVIDRVHDFVFAESQRVACYDPLVRHCFPFLLYPELNVQLVNRKQDVTSQIKQAVLEYVDYIVRNSQPWVASELVASVHVRVPNVKKINLPLACRGVIFDPLTSKAHEMELDSTFSIGADYTKGHSWQISDSTVQFYTDAEMITVTTDAETR